MSTAATTATTARSFTPSGWVIGTLHLPEPTIEAEELVFVHAAEMFGVAELEAE